MSSEQKTLQGTMENPRIAFGSLAEPRLGAAILAVGVLAALIAAGVQLIAPPDLRGTDFRDMYEPLANLVLSGQPYGGEQAVRCPPGYVLILALTFAVGRLFGLPDQAAVIMQVCLLASLTAGLILLLAHRFWNNTRLALIVGLIWLTYPLGVMLYRQPLSEQPYVIMLLLGVITLYAALRHPSRWELFALTGVCAGAAMLIRSAGIGLGVIFALLVIALLSASWKRRGMLAGVVLIVSLLVVAPWEVWLTQYSGRVLALSNAGGFNLRYGMTYAVREDKAWLAGVTVPADVAAYQRAFWDRTKRTTASDQLLAALWDVSRADPVAAVKHFLIKTGRSWYATDTQRNEISILLCQMLYLTLSVWGGARLWKRSPAARPLIVIIACLTFYTWGITIMALSIARYTLPVMPLLFLLIPGIVYPNQSTEALS